MILIFRRRARGLFSTLIRFWTRSEFSHCEIVLAGTAMLSAVEGQGVRMLYLASDDFPADSWGVVTIPTTPEQEALLFRWAMGEIGCRYDWLGIMLCQFLPFGRQHKDRWFCSEFCTAALQSIGLLKGVKPHYQNPGSLYRLLKGLGYEVR